VVSNGLIQPPYYKISVPLTISIAVDSVPNGVASASSSSFLLFLLLIIIIPSSDRRMMVMMRQQLLINMILIKMSCTMNAFVEEQSEETIDIAEINQNVEISYP
jgi:hypothetical protein